MGWRFIDTTNTDPYYVTAVDEAISLARKEKKVSNTLHFYSRNPPAISVGRSKKIHDDINLEKCLNNNIQIVRRTTGGGTIFTDKDCLIYSLVFDKEELKAKSPQERFHLVCTSLISSLKEFEITAVYKPPNDILLNGKKISGSSQIVKGTIVLIHGTILLNTDIELMNAVLTHPNHEYVSTIYRETKKLLAPPQLKKTIKKEFEHTLDTRFEQTPLSSYEKEIVQSLLQQRYHKDAWNYVR